MLFLEFRLSQVPDTESAAAPITAIWEEKTEAMIIEYTADLDGTQEEFKKRPFWDYSCGFREAGKEMDKASYSDQGWGKFHTENQDPTFPWKSACVSSVERSAKKKSHVSMKPENNEHGKVGC